MNEDRQMTQQERQMIDTGCPDCKGDIELYDTNPAGTGGKYRCKKCGRDTVWNLERTLSFWEMINELKQEIESTPGAKWETFPIRKKKT